MQHVPYIFKVFCGYTMGFGENPDMHKTEPLLSGCSKRPRWRVEPVICGDHTSQENAVHHQDHPQHPHIHWGELLLLHLHSDLYNPKNIQIWHWSIILKFPRLFLRSTSWGQSWPALCSVKNRLSSAPLKTVRTTSPQTPSSACPDSPSDMSVSLCSKTSSKTHFLYWWHVCVSDGQRGRGRRSVFDLCGAARGTYSLPALSSWTGQIHDLYQWKNRAAHQRRHAVIFTLNAIMCLCVFCGASAKVMYVD